MGLEELEPALAEQIGLSAGFEETKGNCETCGAEFVRRRTVLNAVRAYIRGAQHSEMANDQRNTDWKLINDLRQKQFHSLEDLATLSSDARKAVPAAAHSLHDAICCLSHAHNLESAEFKMVRGAKQIVFIGSAEPGITDPLEECRTVVDLEKIGWDEHPQFGFVPLIHARHSRPGVNIAGQFCWLLVPLQLASESDLEPLSFESESGEMG